MTGAVIFDVDGVLLELLASEEDAFFAPLRTRYGLTNLSRDWNSYRIRNDDDILAEIFECHLGRAASFEELAAVKHDYLAELKRIEPGPQVIPGAERSLQSLQTLGLTLGIATANLRGAAEVRLRRAGLWPLVENLAFGADGGGHKREILARAVAATGLPRDRIVYLGDNINDVDAGLSNGVHFIGFAREAARRDLLMAAGAITVTGDHATALTLICQYLAPAGQP